MAVKVQLRMCEVLVLLSAGCLAQQIDGIYTASTVQSYRQAQPVQVH